MPATYVIFYAEDGVSPFLEWLHEQQEKVQDRLFHAVARLEELGYELRRPEGDYLRDGTYELRVRRGRVNYRALYFFEDQKDRRTQKIVQRRAMIAHGCTEEGSLEARDIDLAIRRRDRYVSNRAACTYVPPPAPPQD